MSDDDQKSLLDQMERELHRPRPHDRHNEPLFHYTDSNGLLGMVRDRQVWATHCAHVNDSEELVVGERSVDEVAERMVSRLPEKSAGHWLLRNFLHLHKEQGLSLTKSADVYVASFSARGNQLSQWRGYAADGMGYSIGFKGFRLPERDHSEAELGLILARCEYNKEAFTRQVEQVLDEVVIGFETYVKAYCASPKQLEAFTVQAVSIALRRVALLVPGLKNAHFEEEREWRLVAVPMRGHEHKLVRYRASRSGIVPYIPIDLADDGALLQISKVYLGPRQDVDSGLKATRAFLSSHGYKADGLVEYSGIPYRR